MNQSKTSADKSVNCSTMNAEKLFGTRNLYEILQLKKDAEIFDGEKMTLKFTYTFLNIYFLSVAVKKAYYKLALLYHPDRVAADQEEEV